MARVTSLEVKLIMDNCSLDDTQVNAFIAAGTLLIDSVFADDTTTQADLIKEIERWFVAHMIASTVYRTTSEEKVGDASVRYTGQWGKELDSTPYGQMVKKLDTTNLMAGIGRKAASIYAVTSFE